jgi:hypothetical protein
VLTRNILDSLVSLREWTTSPDVGVIPGLTIPSDWQEWDEDDQYDWLIINAVPWYTSFCYSWLTCDAKKLWIDYDEFYSDQEAGIESIFQFFGIPRRDQDKVREEVSDERYKRPRREGRYNPQYLADKVYDQIYAWGPWAAKLKEKLL